MAEIGQQFSPLHALYANLQTHKTVLVLIYLDFFFFLVQIKYYAYLVLKLQ